MIQIIKVTSIGFVSLSRKCLLASLDAQEGTLSIGNCIIFHSNELCVTLRPAFKINLS